MDISVFGMGYVGVVTAACLAAEGHTIIGVDVSVEKLKALEEGIAPIIEDKIGELVEETVRSGRFKVTDDAAVAIRDSEMAIVCVGTPSSANGSLELKYIKSVVTQIGQALRERETDFLLVIRSTMFPGCMGDVVVPLLEASSGKKLGQGLKAVFHPEFLREGTSVSDFYNPPKIVVGELLEGDSKALLEIYGEKFDAPRIVCDVEVAEMVKYCDNMFHALKITFANEVGAFCRTRGIDSHRVMNIFCQDTKLNISHRYLRPGFAFGGSCLPKDLRAFLAESSKSGLNLPMLESILPSNKHQIEEALLEILDKEHQVIGFYGLAFKAGTDDLRESAYLELAERLLGKGKSLLIFDEKVHLSRLIGRNKAHLASKLPHVTDYLVKEAEQLKKAGMIICCHAVSDEMVQQWQAAGIDVYDLESSSRFIA